MSTFRFTSGALVAAISIFVAACDSAAPVAPRESAPDSALPMSGGRAGPVVTAIPEGRTLPVTVLPGSGSLNTTGTFSTFPSGMAALTAPGTPSLIWFANDGSATIWKMNGPAWSGEGATILTIPSPWKLVASGDLNGDGHPDLIWEATTDGTRAVTFMNGSAYAGSYAMMFQFSPDWKIVGTADFDANGHTDIVVHNSATGVNGVLFLNGITWTGSFVQLWSQWGWRLAAVADMNDDAKPDMVLEAQSSGPPPVTLFRVVMLNGTTALPTGGIFTQPTDWRLGAAADFDDDGKGDLLLQNIIDGRRKIRLMNGFQPRPDSAIVHSVSIANMVVSAAKIHYPVAPLNLKISNYYVTQATQDLARSVPLVAGRSALVRVFVTANDNNTAAPKVRVRIIQSGGAASEFLVTRSADPGVPIIVSEGALRTSYNATIPGNLITAGSSISITVDPEGLIAETNESDNTASSSLVVRTMPRFDVRFVPVKLAGGPTGDVTTGNMASYMTMAMKVWPFQSYDADVHAVFNSAQSSIDTDEPWGAILLEIWNLRTVEGSARYYYGVLTPTAAGARWGGVGYLGWPASIGQSGGANVAAHEWGHNFNRSHAPGCGAGGPDAAYPIATGRIDSYGYDALTGNVYSPSAYYDLMSYCGPEWVSGYNVKHVMNFLVPSGSQSAAVMTSSGPALIVSGIIRADGTASLEPAFEVATIPSLPNGAGRFAIEGRDASGALLFAHSFDGQEIPDGLSGERHFSFAIPLSSFNSTRLRQLHVVRAGSRQAMGPASSRSSPEVQAAIAGQAGELMRRAADGVDLTWNAGAHPLVVVRDAATGEVISFARGGSTRLMTKQSGQLELIFSDGVRSRMMRVAHP